MDTIQTADKQTAASGQRLFNYYDCKWGRIEGPIDNTGWFRFRHDDGTSAILNGERVSTYKPHWMK